MGAVLKPPDRETLRSALPIVPILALAALARTWHLSQNGFGRQYYAAGVRSQIDNWHNFIFNAFDPAGFVTIDKPPVALWLQVASAKLFGFGPLPIVMTQVVAGLLAIAILHAMVRRWFGGVAAGCAALALALSPVNVAVDRSNNTESALILVLLIAAWLGMRAAASGRLLPLCAAMAAVGVGFNIKMGEALVLAVVLALAFSLAWRSRPVCWHLVRQAVAGVVLIVVSLAWVTWFDLTPAADRPYAGSTRHNSMLELALLHNGLSRMVPASVIRTLTASQPDAAAAPAAPAPASRKLQLTDPSPSGPLRLFRPRGATQFAWLLPLALAGLVLAWRAPAGAADAVPRRIGAGIWAGWLIGYWLVLSFAGGTTNTYYVAVLGPPLAAFSGIAVAEFWRRMQAGQLPRSGLPLLLFVAAGWQAYLCVAQTGIADFDWLTLVWIGALGVAAGCGCALVLLPQSGRAACGVGVAALCALLVAPALTAASVVIARPTVQAPVADMTALLRPTDPARVAAEAARRDAERVRLTGYLIANRGEATYLVAVPNAPVAAALIIPTGLPVMAMGGYLGDDPILTPASLARLVADGKLRFVMLGGYTLAPSRAAALDPIAQWVRANGRPVDPALWRASGAPSSAPYRIHLGDQWVAVPAPELFDLRPPSG